MERVEQLRTERCEIAGQATEYIMRSSGSDTMRSRSEAARLSMGPGRLRKLMVRCKSLGVLTIGSIATHRRIRRPVANEMSRSQRDLGLPTSQRAGRVSEGGSWLEFKSDDIRK